MIDQTLIRKVKKNEKKIKQVNEYLKKSELIKLGLFMLITILLFIQFLFDMYLYMR